MSIFLNWRRLVRLGILPVSALLILTYNNCGAGFKSVSAVGDLAAQSAQSVMPGSKVFACQSPDLFAASKMQRLTKAQYRNSLVQLFGASAVTSVDESISDIQFDMAIEQPTDFSANFFQSNITVFMEVADGLASKVASDANLQRTLGGDCLAAASPTNDCVNSFISRFGAKVIRRPLSTTETSALQNIAASGSSKGEKFQGLFEYLLQTPDFLYKIELGNGGTGTAADPIRLSSYEIASRLSFLLWDSMPDDELFSLAASDRLKDLNVVRQQIDRMFTNRLAQEKFKLFSNFWLMMNPGMAHAMRDFTSVPAAYVNGIDPVGYKAEVVRETQEFMNYIVFQKNGSYADLMTSPASFARTDDLANTFGHQKVTSTEPAVMADGRRGILMRPIFLAANSAATSPIIRGVRTRSRILCSDFLTPSSSVTSQGPDIGTPEMVQMYSMRERVTMKTMVGDHARACIGCHQHINAYGFVFEGFDTFGRMRSREENYNSEGNVSSSHALNLSSSITFTDRQITVDGPNQLVDQLAASSDGPACLTRQLHRFYKLSAETTDDSCALASAYDGMTSGQGSILEGLKRTIANPSLLYKRIE
jgi:hypothetical protein